jgi:hypothetical protein
MRLLFLLLSAVPALAAPVPKALKAKATTDGIWEWVGFNGHDGRINYAIPKPSYKRIAGDRISGFKRSPADLTDESLAHHIRVRDDQQPNLRTYDIDGAKYSAVVELDGDTLRLAYATDPQQAITECKPAAGVYYYEFKRVKDEK